MQRLLAVMAAFVAALALAACGGGDEDKAMSKEEYKKEMRLKAETKELKKEEKKLNKKEKKLKNRSPTTGTVRLFRTASRYFWAASASYFSATSGSISE